MSAPGASLRGRAMRNALTWGNAQRVRAVLAWRLPECRRVPQIAYKTVSFAHERCALARNRRFCTQGKGRPARFSRCAWRGCTCRAVGCRGILLRSGVRGACRTVGRDGTHSAWRARRALAALRDGGALDRCVAGCGALVARWDGGAALCRGRGKAELALCWARTGPLRGAAKTSTGRNRGPLVEAGVSGVCWPKP